RAARRDRGRRGLRPRARDRGLAPGAARLSTEFGRVGCVEAERRLRAGAAQDVRQGESVGKVKKAKAAKDDAAEVEFTRDDVLAVLRRETPRAVPHDLVIYADAFMSYREAMENIDRNGTIVAHPRTAAPIENPYLKVRDAAARVIRGMKGIKTGDLWER